MEIMNIHGSYIVFKCVVSRFQRTLNSNACTADWKRACKAFLLYKYASSSAYCMWPVLPAHWLSLKSHK